MEGGFFCNTYTRMKFYSAVLCILFGAANTLHYLLVYFSSIWHQPYTRSSTRDFYFKVVQKLPQSCSKCPSIQMVANGLLSFIYPHCV